MKKEDELTTKRITMERFTITSTKPFADVISAIDSQVGHPDIMQFYAKAQNAADDEELRRLVDQAAEDLGLDIVSVIQSPKRGADGNFEFLALYQSAMA